MDTSSSPTSTGSSASNSTNTSIFVLLALLVLAYFTIHKTSSSSEAMTMLRYRPFMSGQPAPIDFDENIAGIPDPNSHEVLPNVNQYANNLAFNPNNPNSANYTVNGRSVLNPSAYQYLGDRDRDVNGRN
jgi:hypothetical protein